MSRIVVASRTGSLNVVTLGDSLAWGAGDEVDGGLAGRLNQLLIERGYETVQATNLGVNGAQTSDVLRKLHSTRVREAISRADLVILSIGANDLFRTPDARNRVMRDPFAVAEHILTRIRDIVDGIVQLNAEARIVLLGGYNPVPSHPMAFLIDQYLVRWDDRLASAFSAYPLVRVVKMADLVIPARLGRADTFHPGGEAYQHAAERIAQLVLEHDTEKREGEYDDQRQART